MKNIYSLVITNLIIIALIFFLYLGIGNARYLYLFVLILLTINFIIIYKKSDSFDKKEQQKKILLHKIKNSLSVILGYNDAYNDKLISKNELDENLNSEIEKIVEIIKKEIYK